MQPEDLGVSVRNHKAEASPASGDRKTVAEYVGAMSRDLSELARRDGFVTLAYLLDMARLEAETISRGGGREGIFRVPSESSEQEVDAG